MPYDETDVQDAIRHVAETQKLIARQRQIVAYLEMSDAPTEAAEQILQRLEANLQIFERCEITVRAGFRSATPLVVGEQRQGRRERLHPNVKSSRSVGDHGCTPKVYCPDCGWSRIWRIGEDGRGEWVKE